MLAVVASSDLLAGAAIVAAGGTAAYTLSTAGSESGEDSESGQRVDFGAIADAIGSVASNQGQSTGAFGDTINDITEGVTSAASGASDTIRIADGLNDAGNTISDTIESTVDKANSATDFDQYGAQSGDGLPSDEEIKAGVDENIEMASDTAGNFLWSSTGGIVLNAAEAAKEDITGSGDDGPPTSDLETDAQMDVVRGAFNPTSSVSEGIKNARDTVNKAVKGSSGSSSAPSRSSSGSAANKAQQSAKKAQDKAKQAKDTVKEKSKNLFEGSPLEQKSTGGSGLFGNF